ncbi:MAG: hypothetical protein M1838_003664 [Thelocarpon superellum]|nr:MAG: hypothetical protein M1838_003664 [Thelocarpon superellum]
MSDYSISPPKATFGRLIHPSTGFLPLSADEVLSTRGSHLPALLRTRSTTSMQGGAGGSTGISFNPFSRRHRTFLQNDDHSFSRRSSLLRDDDDLESADGEGEDGRQSNSAHATLMTPKMRSMRLIGNSNPRYQWETYRKTEEELKQMQKPIRQYYERTNFLIEQYIYIDRLLDSSLPHTLIQEYHQPASVDVPQTISEEPSPLDQGNGGSKSPSSAGVRVKRTPKNIYKVPNEDTPLLSDEGEEANGTRHRSPREEEEDEEEEQKEEKMVKVAIYINLLANTILLGAKIAVIVLTSSLSVLASLVDAVLDFLSTAIVWITTRLIARKDRYAYPVGRQRLEPIGVLVFSVVMITSFVQVLLECFNRLTSGDHSVVQLGLSAIVIMASTVVIKFACWLWCRLIPNSSVQALAQDAMTDVIFNTFSIIFPLVGYYLHLWPLDAIGGILLSLYIIINWGATSYMHIQHLTGASATADERNILLYLTMRFARTITQIQGLQAYHAGDRLNVEVDIVLDPAMPLRDSHDLGESLQYVLESVPFVDRAFVHADYKTVNLPTHMAQ